MADRIIQLRNDAAEENASPEVASDVINNPSKTQRLLSKFGHVGMGGVGPVANATISSTTKRYDIL